MAPTLCSKNLILVAAIALGCGSGERKSADYATHAEAVADGAVARGWIPTWVPAEAVTIREIHDLDTNEVCIRFALPPDRRAALVATMRALPAEEIETLPPSCSLGPSWWFEGLIQQQPANDGSLYADVFEAPGIGPALLVAADTLSPTIYIWSR